MAEEKKDTPAGCTPAGPGDQMSIDNLERYCHSYISAMDHLCQSTNQLAGICRTLCHNTPLEDVISQWQQTWASLEKSSSDAGHLVNMEVAKCAQNYWDEDRTINVKSDNKLLILARIIFLLFQSQTQFWGCVDQMLLPLQEMSKGPLDMLLGGAPSDLSAVCASWIRGMQAADNLRLGERLVQAEVRLLSEPNGINASLKQKLRANLQIYANEMLKLPTSEIVLRAGFQSNVSLLSTLLLVSANPRQRQDLLDRVLQDRSLQYLNQLYLDKTENATSLFEEIKSYLSATGSGFKLVIDRKPCGDNMDMASKLNSITAEIEKVIPGDSLVSPHFLSLLVALNTHPDVSSLQTLSAVQLVFGHPHVLTVKPQVMHSVVDVVQSQHHSLIARTTSLWHLLGGHPFLVDNGCHFATVEARYEYSLTLARTGYNSSSTVTLRLNKNEEVLKSNSCSNVKSREISPLSVLNADDALDRLTKSFAEMPVPSSSPPVPARLDLNQDASMMMQGDQVTDTRNMPTKPQTLVGPTVTITSELSPTEEPGKWAPLGSSRYFGKYRAKPNLASDAEVQDIVDFLSGCPPKHSTGSLLDPPNKSPQDSITPNSSSSSSSNHSSGWGSLGGGDSNAIRYGSYNPQYQELDSQFGGRKSPMPHGHHWTGQPYQTHSQMGQMYVPDPRMMGDPTNEAEFAHYVAANAIVKRVPLTSECSPTHMHGGHWSPTAGDQMNRTWPGRENDNNSRKNSLNNTWSTAHDSASSSDESSNNGEGMLSMGLGLSGQNLLHSVSRRRHSSDDACESIKPNESIMEVNPHYLDVVQMDSKSTKTWPPKVIWQQQRALSPQNPAVGSHREAQPVAAMMPKDTLNVHPPLTPQWSDPVTFRNQPGWSYMTGSTPVSPAGSMTMIPHGFMSPMSGPGHPLTRGHPKLDRRPAHPGHFS